MVKPDELITGRQMGPRGIVGAEQHGENLDISHTHAHTRAKSARDLVNVEVLGLKLGTLSQRRVKFGAFVALMKVSEGQIDADRISQCSRKVHSALFLIILIITFHLNLELGPQTKAARFFWTGTREQFSHLRPEIRRSRGTPGLQKGLLVVSVGTGEEATR